MEVMISAEVLGNFGIMSATVIAIVEAIKRLINLCSGKKVPVRALVIMSLIIAFGFSFAYVAYVGNWTILSVALAIANGFGIFGAATAGYKVVKEQTKKIEKKKLMSNK